MSRFFLLAWPLACLAATAELAEAQQDTARTHVGADSAQQLGTITVTAPREPRVVEVPPPVAYGVVFAAKTAQVIHVDSTGANIARDVTRQVVGRIPGADISETEAGGFPANGIGFRGLNPTQSIEMNVRQDGVNIAGDPYGYNEVYYSPPAEAIADVQVVRGASSLAFGPQFGGAINYLLKSGRSNTSPAVDAHQSVGSFGLFDTFGSLGGGAGPFTYYALVQHRSEDGWRPNSDYDQTDAYARMGYQLSRTTRVNVEYTRFRNRIHMPGGLTDAQFSADPQTSDRARNWLASPWNIAEAQLDSRLSDRLHLYLTSSLTLSQRYLVWRNEDGGAQAPDSIDPATNAFAPREVERERFYNVANEARLQFDHFLFGRPNTLATGLRVFDGNMQRAHGGLGTTGSDFNMTVVAPYANDLHFGTTNVAAYAEDLLHITDRWTIAPGARAEWLRSTIRGRQDTTAVPAQSTGRAFALAGIGTEYLLGATTTLYANWSQAYRPITYDALTPFGTTSRISPYLKDSHGYDVDVGVRGPLARGVSGSLTGFYMEYDHREGLFSGFDTTTRATFTEQATIGNSVAKGIEAYVAVAPFVSAGIRGPLARVSIFDAASYDDAHYVSGPFKGRWVERAPQGINRGGITYDLGPGSTTLQVATQTHSFTDANNTLVSPDNAGVGVIPGYTVLDWSMNVTLARRYGVSFTINNLTSARYFTQRTTEYPGPGIIPSPGRSLTLGVSYASGR